MGDLFGGDLMSGKWTLSIGALFYDEPIDQGTGLLTWDNVPDRLFDTRAQAVEEFNMTRQHLQKVGYRATGLLKGPNGEKETLS